MDAERAGQEGGGGIGPGATVAAIEATLTGAAERVWGAERLPELRPSLGSAAAAIARVLGEPLDLLDEIPETP
jgi:hypothetical protein